VRTCPGVPAKDQFNGKSAHGKVCAINWQAALFAALKLISTIWQASTLCAETFVMQDLFTCGGSIAGLLQAVIGMGTGTSLIMAACREHGAYHLIENCSAPSNCYEESAEEIRKYTQPKSRRLMFGGGKDAQNTMCAVYSMGSAWSIAEMGLEIDRVANADAGGVCNYAHLHPNVTGNYSDLADGMCAKSVSEAIKNLLYLVTQLLLITISCTDTLKLNVICGSGITGLLGSLAGVARSGADIWLSCEQEQQDLMANITLWDFDHPNESDRRRLRENIDFETLKETFIGSRGESALKERFSSPAEVWKSLGYDIEDSRAEFRKHIDFPRSVSHEEILELLDDPTTDAAKR
jgi:hypothetical protein